jgi:hypothetical protein
MATTRSRPSPPVRRNCHACGVEFLAEVSYEMRCENHREQREPPPVVIQHWMVEPSAESRRPETRLGQFSASRAVAEGQCRWCGGLRQVNYRDECAGCQTRAVEWVRPSNRTPRWVPMTTLAQRTAKAERKGTWKRDKDRQGVSKDVGNHYAPVSRPDPPKWRRRPWQRYAWQVKDALKPRNRRSRTAPERLYLPGDRGVWLRCLVCLSMTDRLRYDQVCETCDRRWREAGGPWREDFEVFTMDRRVTTDLCVKCHRRVVDHAGQRLGHRPRKSEHDYLAAFGRAADYLEFRRPPLGKIKPLTRGTTTMLFDSWENGSGGEIAPAVFSRASGS